jgi:catalase-peroxidase
MGPKSLYFGGEVPKEDLIWQDPIPAVTTKLINQVDVDSLKVTLANSRLNVSQLVSTAWASASTYRNSDKRGGANGARLSLSPQKDWDVNNPSQLQAVLKILNQIKIKFNTSQTDGKEVSLADLIVLGGCVGIEKAAKNAGQEITVPFAPGRTDALEEQTDVVSFSVLEPNADGFRNYLKANYTVSPEEMLLDKAQLMCLTAPELTVLLGGMRVLNTNFNQSNYGVFTKNKELLSNDFFINLLDINTTWSATSHHEDVFEGRDRSTGYLKWTGTRVDLIFGSNSELRAIAEVYGFRDANEKFVRDFVSAWTKVMNLDRFDIE